MAKGTKISILEYILKKYNIKVGRQYSIEIPNMDRKDLAQLFAELQFKTGVEIGVERGIYSEVLLQANPKLHLFSIDPWKATAYDPKIPDVDKKQSHYDACYKSAKKRLSPYNSKIIRKTSMNAIKDFKDNSLDFVYIDGNHDFKNVTNDIHFWKEKIRPGGILAGHDYAYFPSGKHNHVKKVVDAYMQSYHMLPYFIVGATEYIEGVKRDRFRSWFWVKNEQYN